jgi:hypothetical protein
MTVDFEKCDLCHEVTHEDNIKQCKNCDCNYCKRCIRASLVNFKYVGNSIRLEKGSVKGLRYTITCNNCDPFSEKIDTTDLYKYVYNEYKKLTNKTDIIINNDYARTVEKLCCVACNRRCDCIKECFIYRSDREIYGFCAICANNINQSSKFDCDDCNKNIDNIINLFDATDEIKDNIKHFLIFDY